MLDTVVGTALMLVVFVGISSAFQLAIQAVGNNAARAGAIALANERIEYIRSLSYDAIGTAGGIPSGALPQIATTTLNNIPYTQRIFVGYEDDPNDGTGVDDTNDIVVDYKAVKVTISWESRQGTRTITMVGRISPPNGIEADVPGGTLVVHVVDAAFQPIQNAQVTVENPGVSPAVDLTIYTDETGTATLLGVPPAGGYILTATKAGYSTAQTYEVSAQNTNPIPAHLGVAAYQTTAATFEIDLLSTLRIEAYEEIVEDSWSDGFANDVQLATTSNIDIVGRVQLAGGEGAYATEGFVQSADVTASPLFRWGTVSWSDERPAGTGIIYRVYDTDGDALPNGVLAGNSSGFSSPPIDLSGVSTSTHGALRIGASLSSTDANVTPSIDDWSVTYEIGPTPLADIDFNLRGAKTIGTNAGGALIYKYDADHTTSAQGLVTLSDVEWDLYTLSVPSSTGYDIVSSCPPQPVGVLPSTESVIQIYLADHTTNSLLVDVRSSDGAIVPNASVQLQRGVYDATEETDLCGHVLYRNLSSGTVGSGNPYTINVSASGYTAYTSSEVNVTGTSRLSIILY